MESFITKSPSNVNFTSASAKKLGVHSQRSKLSDIGSSKNLENFKNEGKKGKNLQMPMADEYMLVEKNGIQNKLSTKHIQVRIDYGSTKPSIEKISS